MWTGLVAVLSKRGRKRLKRKQLPPYLSSWAWHHAIFILTLWASHAVKQMRFTPEVSFVFLLSICSTPAQPCLGAYRETDPCLSNSVVTIKIWSEAGLHTNPPTHSKSKCAIKNAYLSSSSRLSNAYASYPRDQMKWYCKQYRICFIRYTIQISSGGICWVSFPVLPCSLSLGKVKKR